MCPLLTIVWSVIVPMTVDLVSTCAVVYCVLVIMGLVLGIYSRFNLLFGLHPCVFVHVFVLNFVPVPLHGMLYFWVELKPPITYSCLQSFSTTSPARTTLIPVDSIFVLWSFLAAPTITTKTEPTTIASNPGSPTSSSLDISPPSSISSTHNGSAVVSASTVNTGINREGCDGVYEEINDQPLHSNIYANLPTCPSESQLPQGPQLPQ
uniref:Uncharacterized protein n=1 Tax=Oncorhynchus kisutch TaxID=8019 RepID=A0A8C7HZ69_ONCKI